MSFYKIYRPNSLYEKFTIQLKLSALSTSISRLSFMPLTKQRQVKESQQSVCNSHCILNHTDLKGHSSCLMNSVKSSWQNPAADFYCEDPAAKNFVRSFEQKITLTSK
jgi:hypothetical protein